jgi:hypothetical protein
MTPLQVLLAAFAAWLVWDLLSYVRSGTIRRHATVFLGRSWVQWVAAVSGGLAAFVVVAIVALSLVALWPAGFGFTWLRLLATPADGPVEGVNLMVAPATIPWFGFAFLALLMFNVPRLARLEEDVFRRGTRGWRDGCLRSVKFGLAHCLIGVPIGWGLALSVGGLWFTWHYFRGGVRRAWFYHVIYNLMLLTILGVWLAVMAANA